MSKIVTYGILVALGALWLWDWALMRILLRQERWIQDLRRQGQVEQRCGFCLVKDCPAKNTGVAYPCPHFRYIFTEKEMEDLYGENNEHPDP